MTPAPLRLRRVFKERLWAGRQMASVFGYDMPDGEVGECWSVGARPDSPPTVVGGPHDAETLLTVREEDGDFFGDDSRPSFPLLVKFVDAREGSRCRSTHMIGWEHTFIHEIHHLLTAIAEDGSVGPHGATFEDGYRAAEICDAVLRSAATGSRQQITYRGG